MKELLVFFREVIDEFTDIIKEIIHPQTFFAFMFYATFCYLLLRGQPMPETLRDIVFTTLGYFFGSVNKSNGAKNSTNGQEDKKVGV